MVESIEMLGQICSQKEPPLELAAIQEVREGFLDPQCDKAGLRAKLKGMTKAFEERGDVAKWDNKILDKIDECFVKHFMESGKATPVLFVPRNADGTN